MNKPFLILSHHRSGSNFMCNLLCENSKIECLNEPLSMHTDFFKKNDLIIWKKDEFNKEYLHQSLKQDKLLIDFLKELKELINSDNKIMGFKETLLFEKLDWLKEFIPNLNIVFIVRDPRAIIRKNMWKNMWGYNLTVKRHIEKYYDKPIECDYNNPIHLITWSIKIRYDCFIKYKDLFNYKIVRLEDIVNDPFNNMAEVMSFLGTEITKEQCELLNKVYSNDEKRGSDFSYYTTKERVLSDWKGKIEGNDQKYVEKVLHREMEKFRYL